MRSLLRTTWNERGAILFVLWTLAVLFTGGELKRNFMELMPLVGVYVLFDLLYYGSQVILFSAPSMRALRGREGRTFTSSVIAEIARSKSLRRLVWLALFVGLLQPMTTVITAYWINIEVSHYKMVFGYLIFDFCSTAIVWTRITSLIYREKDGYIRPVRTEDLQELLRVEGEAFRTLEQWSEADIRKAVETGGSTTIVYVYRGEIKGVLYMRPVNSSQVLGDDRLSWYDLANGCDLAAMEGADSLYGISLAAVPCDIPVSDKLLVAGYVMVVRLGLRHLMGCLRIPCFYRYASSADVTEYLTNLGGRTGATRPDKYELRTMQANKSLAYPADEYVHARRQDGTLLDPLIRSTVRGLSLRHPWGVYEGAKVVRCVHDYFGDPRSLDKGALMIMSNPFRCIPCAPLVSLLVGRVLSAI